MTQCQYYLIYNAMLSNLLFAFLDFFAYVCIKFKIIAYASRFWLRREP